METNPTTTRQEVAVSALKRISWPSIFAGAIIAIGIQLLLSFLGIGIGASTVNPQTELNPAAGLGTGALIWWIITFLISVFIGAFITGRLAATLNRTDGVINGLLTWTVFVLLNLYFLTSAVGGILNTAGGVLGNASMVAGQSAANNPSGFNNMVQGQMDKYNLDPNQIKQDIQNPTPQQKAQARTAGDDVAKAVAKTGFFAFIGLLLGAIVAAFAARAGMRSEPAAVVTNPNRAAAFG